MSGLSIDIGNENKQLIFCCKIRGCHFYGPMTSFRQKINTDKNLYEINPENIISGEQQNKILPLQCPRCGTFKVCISPYKVYSWGVEEISGGGIKHLIEIGTKNSLCGREKNIVLSENKKDWNNKPKELKDFIPCKKCLKIKKETKRKILFIAKYKE